MTEESSEDWLPPGWTVEVRVRKHGKRDKYYFAPSSGLRFNSRAEVSRYLNTQEVCNPKPEPKIKDTLKRSARNVVVEKAIAEGLPPGWIKEIRVTKKGHKIRRDPFYIDPVSGYIFHSMKDVLRYLETGELGRLASKPKDIGSTDVELEDDNIASPAVAKKQKSVLSSTREQVICDQSSKWDVMVKDEQIPSCTEKCVPLSGHTSDQCRLDTDLSSSNLPEAKVSEQIEGRNDSAKSVFVSAPAVGLHPANQSLKSKGTMHENEKTQLDMRKSKSKKEYNLPRRASKRLAGLDIGPTPELKTSRARRFVKQPGEAGASTPPSSSPGSLAHWASPTDPQTQLRQSPTSSINYEAIHKNLKAYHLPFLLFFFFSPNLITCNQSISLFEDASNFFPTMMTLSLVITALITLIHFPSSSYADNEQYLNCSKPFDWAGVGDLSYPFWGVSRPSYCGHPGFELNCIDDVPHIKMTDINYQVLHVDNVSRTLKVARKDYWNTVCPATFVNTTINSTVFDYNSATTNLTLFYDCPVSSIYQADSTPFNCSINGTDATNYYFKNTNLSSIGNPLGTCKYNVKVPVLQSAAQTGSNLTEAALIQAIDGGFMLGWDANNMLCDGCKATGGQCGYNTSTSEFACYCVNGTFPFTCHVSPIRQQSSKSNWGLKIAIGISVAVAGTVMISFVIIYGIKRGHFSSNSMVRWQIDSKNDHFNTEEILRSNELLAPKRYTYSNLKNITNSFKEKVGQGGYGDVYKGELPDGRMVAVKILSASKGNGEQFINEVASITRTSHVNVVTLLGFCYEMTKRALIYEFMPNGSLDKVIYDKGSPITNNHLDTKKMFQIAIGIARGLEYLHRGCNTRILHFDIKPHNILLDEDFHPKISDFGLAKLCSTKESIVSMKGMRGTIGYIAPEVFSRCFGGVSHKSDVYSYGMLVLEMVGGRKNFDGGLSQTSETYFPHWIYNKLQQGESFETFRDLTNEEEDTLKKMIIVSLWCTQTSPLDRPSMGKVIEMLEGSLQSLQFPPKPVMHSPVRSPQDCFTTSQSQNPTS